MKRIPLLFIVFTLFIVFSCKTTSLEQNPANTRATKDELHLVICGDVMCHTQNFKTKNFNMIWDGVRDITSRSDFTIANIEAPVCADKPFENYPCFNMQPSYPQAAIDAGINLITLANNHTNDQGGNGIISTAAWSRDIQEKYSGTSRPVYFSGLKEDVSSDEVSKNSPVTYCYFTKDNFRILFLGVTQILNSQVSAPRINYFPHTKKGKNDLYNLIVKLKNENPCDVFILALHSDEPEYNLTIFKERSDWYDTLLEAGVDILWANHPHCPKPVRYLKDPETGHIKKVVLYSTGNTISGQRHRPNYKNPGDMHEYTGEGFLVNLNLKKTKNEVYFDSTQINYITTFIDKDRNYLIKPLNETFYNELEETGNTAWKDYLIERERLLSELKEITEWTKTIDHSQSMNKKTEF